MPLIQIRRQFYTILAIIMVVAAAIGGGIYYRDHKTSNQTQTYKYSKGLESYTLDSVYKGAGMSFKKPSELKQKNRSVSVGRSQAFFSQSQTTEERSQNKLAYLGASSVQSSNAASDSYLKFLGGVLLNSSSNDYLAIVSPIQEFIRHSTDNRVVVELTSAKDFRSAHINKNAWVLDFKATTTDNGIWPINGKVILEAGNRTFYYFMVGATDSNWQSNQKVWQQTLDSLKIDQ